VNTLFFGTPLLAVPYLELLEKETDLKAVITTPDEPAGRGYERQESAVKQAALKLNKPVLQPADVKDPAFRDQLAGFSPDLAIVVAYGKILPLAVLETSKHGFLNVHFSLLPAYRGAAPIQHALIQGKSKTGVTLFWLDQGMDTGPICLQKSIQIDSDDNAETLRGKLVPLGVEALQSVLKDVQSGRINRRPQDGPASLAPTLTREDGRIDWSKPAQEIANRIRGTNPWPGSFTFVRAGDQSQRLKILAAKPVPGAAGSSVGAVASLESGKGFVVKCGQDSLQILLVQPEGKKPMPAWDYWQGKRITIGQILG